MATALDYIPNPLTVDRGGTGAQTLTGILKGNGTGAVTALLAQPARVYLGTLLYQTLGNAQSSTIAGSSTYYYIAPNFLTNNSGHGQLMYPPVACKLMYVRWSGYVGGTLGTTEKSTLEAWKNSSSASTISSGVIEWSAIRNTYLFDASSLNITLNGSTDYIYWRFQSPASFSTTPTNVSLRIEAWFAEV